MKTASVGLLLLLVIMTGITIALLAGPAASCELEGNLSASDVRSIRMQLQHLRIEAAYMSLRGRNLRLGRILVSELFKPVAIHGIISDAIPGLEGGACAECTHKTYYLRYELVKTNGLWICTRTEYHE